MRWKEQSFVIQGLTWLLQIVLLYSFNLQLKDEQCCIVPLTPPTTPWPPHVSFSLWLFAIMFKLFPAFSLGPLIQCSKVTNLCGGSPNIEVNRLGFGKLSHSSAPSSHLLLLFLPFPSTTSTLITTTTTTTTTTFTTPTITSTTRQAENFTNVFM